MPLKDDGVYWYRAGLKENDVATPIWVQFDSIRFDQQQNKMIFDSETQKLIVVWKYVLEDLGVGDSM